MPRLEESIAKHQYGFIAWRWAYFLPGAMHITFALLTILFAQARTCKNRLLSKISRQLLHVHAKA